MPLNISAASKDRLASTRRRKLTDALLDELLSWNPREFVSAFRRWQRGSLSLIHLNVLTILESDGPLSMGQLAEELDVSVASMTGIIDRMHARGLVERRHGADDRRVVLVHPTDAGAGVFREIDQHRRDGLESLLAELTDKQMLDLLVGHRALRRARAKAKKRRAEEKASVATTRLELEGANR